ncbi:hypothetical protein [Methylomarinum vadi]|uniref:hypothetical protein n=1 Tax=Methylomarinum vadi TaxID=438855 RepID=UPI0004DF8D06|nr:hypothetical protein [Methylomarinum vadi]
MAEVLFILTTVFVAYVVFVVVECEKRKIEEAKQKAKPAASKPAAAAKAESAVKAESAAKTPAPSEKKPASAAAKPQSQPASAAGSLPDTLKNPETGEEVKVPNNYRFTKRWIKEALVAEGLLDKIYKNNELDEEATAKIKAAMDQLKMMDKYH